MSFQPVEDHDQVTTKVTKIDDDESTPLISNLPSAPASYVQDEVTPASTRLHNKVYTLLSHRLAPLILVLTITLLSVYLILLPIIIQKFINLSQVELISTTISRPFNTSFQIGIRAKLIPLISLPLQARTNKMKVKVKYSDEVIGTTTIPELNVYGKRIDMNIEDTFEVVNGPGLSKFATDLIQKTEVGWLIEGDLEVQVLGRKYSNLYLKKTMVLKGMQGLKDIKINHINIPANSPFGGIKVNINATLNNPTTNNLSVGSVLYGIHYKEVFIGEVLATNLTLKPNENELELKGRLYSQTNPYKLEVLGEFVTKYLTNKPLLMTIKGIKVDPPINWLAEAIRNHEMEITYINPKKFQLVQSIQILDLHTKFDLQTAYSPLTSANLLATIESPFDFPFQIENVGERFDLYRPLNVFTNNGDIMKRTRPMAKIAIPLSHAETSTNDSLILINTSYKDVALAVEPILTARWSFENFLSDIVFGSQTSLAASGFVDAQVLTNIGKLQLTNLPTDLELKFQGLKKLLNPPPQLSDLTLTGVTNGKVNFKASLSIVNPTTFSISLGSVLLDVVYKDLQVGTVNLLDFNLKGNQTNNILILGTFDLPKCKLSGCTNNNNLIRQQFLTKYTTGKQLPVIGLGSFRSTPIPSLKPALAKLNYNLTIPPVEQELMQSSKYSFFSGSIQLDLTNPFDFISINILALNVTSCRNGTVAAEIQLDSFAKDQFKLNPNGILPIALPAASSVQTKWLPVKLIASGWSLLWNALGGSIVLDNKVSVLVSLNNDPNSLITLDFQKEGVKAKVGF